MRPSKRLKRIDSEENVISKATQRELDNMEEFIEEELQSLGILKDPNELAYCAPNNTIDHELLLLVVLSAESDV